MEISPLSSLWMQSVPLHTDDKVNFKCGVSGYRAGGDFVK